MPNPICNQVDIYRELLLMVKAIGGTKGEGDAWLASWIFFENFSSEFFKTTL